MMLTEIPGSRSYLTYPSFSGCLAALEEDYRTTVWTYQKNGEDAELHNRDMDLKVSNRYDEFEVQDQSPIELSRARVITAV
ncbi:hypothetical protein FXO38_10766 [Capsicum annuum]|uniref:Uncharacterized protein n=1 Tax=Capsicum annuum TaxID=4072 RepID=A0A2G3AKQ0_CAPAN|nr:hypothetical protein FXO38_10766 [Capsicum annuum]PHT94819.1 hypothetical protein T459_02701 [Capsicum annuum]